MPKDQSKLRAQIIAKAWKDPAYKQKLLKNPKAALKEMGWELPANFDVRVIEDKQNSFTFVLPQPVAQIHELSEEQLHKIAGGAWDSWDGHCGQGPTDEGWLECTSKGGPGSCI